jgi:hypothetical protein
MKPPSSSSTVQPPPPPLTPEQLRWWAEESDRRLREAVLHLRRFYVAWSKPEWQEGTSADEYACKVRLFLDEQAVDGLVEADIDRGENP